MPRPAAPDPRPAPRPGRPRQLLEPLLHVYTGVVAVIAAPLLDLLGRTPEFFVARGLDRGGAAAVALGLTLLLPLPLALARLAVSPSAPLRRLTDTLLFGLLAALFLLYLIRQQLDAVLTGLPAVLLSLLLGLPLGLLYAHRAAVRLFVTFLAPVLVIVPGLFFVNPLFRAVSAPAEETDPVVATTADFPIVMVVFDAMSSQGLLAANGEIDRHRYPHLAALAERSTWFPGAATVSRRTVRAVPAILTGRLPRRDRLPRLEEHRRNLFTLLEPHYRLVAVESVTRLCPANCEDPTRERSGDRRGGGAGTLVTDLGVLYLHLVLPRPFRGSLPAVDQGWHPFVEQRRSTWPGYDRPALFRDFLHHIEPGSERTLYFLHLLLPHSPYEYLPSGRNYRARGGVSPSQEREVELQYRRYLLQLGLVDRLIGELVGRLEELDLFDRSLLILTADHGPRYLRLPGDPPGSNRDSEWIHVPLIVKSPGQGQGEVSPLPASTLDILPTILDRLALPIPPQIEGTPLAQLQSERDRRMVMGGEIVPLPPESRAELGEVLRWKVTTFGDGSEASDLYRRGGPAPHLAGRRLEELVVVEAEELELVGGSGRVDFDPADGHAPTWVEGKIEERLEAGSRLDCCSVAIALNGVIEVTVTAAPAPGRGDGGEYGFAALLPESALVPGENRVEVLVIDPEADDRLLRLHSRGFVDHEGSGGSPVRPGGPGAAGRGNMGDGVRG